ncbi:MAG: hypothetical protein Q9222_005341 [Ikaeria aurantiellina]
MDRQQRSKAHETPTARREVPTKDRNDFLSRIEASRSRLIQETIVHPRPSSILPELASSVAEGHKSGPSSNMTSLSAASTAEVDVLSAHPFSPYQRIMPHSLRSQPPLQKVREAQKQLDVFVAPWDPDVCRADESNESEGWSIDPPPIHHGDSTAISIKEEGIIPLRFAKPPLPAFGELRQNESPMDGAAVVALLSDPSFCVDDMPGFVVPDDGIECSLSNTENVSKDASSQPYFSNAHHNYPFSLIPSVLAGSETPQMQGTNEPAQSTANDVRVQEGLFQNLGCAKEFHVEPWLDILTTYHDEVWGDALPLVHHARKEADAILSGNISHDKRRPALERLAMLVSHIKHGMR